MNKWNVISVEFFLKILKFYTGKSKWTLDKILEIQDIQAIKNGFDTRFYLGSGIKFEDFKGQKQICKELLGALDLDIGVKDFNMMILSEDMGPVILPILNSLNDLIELLFGSSKKPSKKMLGFNESSKWFIKKGGKLKLDSNNIYPDKERFIRVRVIDLNTWKSMINKYIDTGELDYCEDDIKKEEISY